MINDSLLITLPLLEPRPYQLPLFKNMYKYKRFYLLWHRRAGKDLVSLNFMLMHALRRVGTYFIVFPFYTQARKVIWEGKTKDGVGFLDYIPQDLIASRNETTMLIRLINGSIIQIVGADRPDSLVGTNPVGVIYSEFALQKPSAYNLLSPILAENDGWALVETTPRGKNHAYDLWEHAQSNPNEWFSSRVTVEDSQAISPEKLAAEREAIIRRTSDDALYQQEYMTSFIAALQGAYYAENLRRAEQEGRITEVLHDSSRPVFTVWDLGISDATAILYWQIIKGVPHLLDAEEHVNTSLIDIIRRVKEKPYNYAGHFAPHDIQVRDYGTGLTRLETAKQHNILFQVIPKTPVMERIEAGRTFFSSIKINKNLSKLLSALNEYTKEFDEDTGLYKDRPHHDHTSHYADSYGYSAQISSKMIDTFPKARVYNPKLQF